jgi:uncharacterized membrane protein
MAYRPLREADRSGTHFVVSSLVLWLFTFLVGAASVSDPLRTAGTLALGVLVFGGLLWWRNRFSHFCEEWLLADLPLRPSTRNAWPRRSRSWKDVVSGGRELFALLSGRTLQPSSELVGHTEALAIVSVAWLYLGFVPRFVPSDLACLILFSVCALAWATLLRPCSIARLRRMFVFSYRLRRVYFTYPDRTIGQQGLWSTPQSLIGRQATYCLALGSLFGLIALVLAGKTIALPLILIVLLLPLVAEIILFTVLLPDVLHLEALANDITTHDHGPRCPWEQLIDRKAGSYQPEERERILWALDAKTLEPILVERTILAEHVHIRGATGSGKTSGALIPVALQLLEKQSSEQKPDPIIIFDLGGDQAMFHAVRLAAEQKGRRFRFFSVQGGHASDYFDPLQGLLKEEMRTPQLASMFVEAFNLDYGLRYGAQYFTEQNLSSFLTVIRYYRQHHQRHPTLQSFYQFLRDNQQKSEFRNAEQILMCISFLLDYPQLNSRQPDPTADDHIYLPRVLEDSEVVYFFLPTLNESAFVREIAGLALYGLLAAAMERGNSGQNATDPRQAWVIIDEFHELVGASFANLLAQSRKFGLGLILANQSTVQLDNKDVNLAALVEENTALRQYFTITSPDIMPFQRLSGDEEKIRTRKTTAHGSASVSQDWVKEPALELNEILEASGQRQDCFLIVRDGKGAAKPRHAVTLYPMSYDEYRRLRHLPLPRRQTPAPEPDAEQQHESAPQSATTADDGWRDERQRRLAALWDRFATDQKFDPPKRRSKA